MELDWFAPFAAMALCCGLLAKGLKLPPLIGFLAAGFLLKAIGYELPGALDRIADVGVTLLLFAIGLKLQVRGLLAPSIWAGATIHAALISLAFGGLLWGLAALEVGPTAGLSGSLCLLLGFAMSFSSTVFAVKVQEEQGDAAARHARLAIGILIMQDIFAVVFLAAAKGQQPSPWALLVVPGMLAARWGFFWLMTRAGHGELLILLGWLLPMIGYFGFEAVALKGDLGALMLGASLAGHPKAGELAKSLLSFKDLFLVGFFLTIGLKAEPSWAALGLAALFVALLPIKMLLFFFLLTRFKLLARTAVLTTASLACYSEFGLIVADLAFKKDWIGSEWLAVLALTVALSFVIAAQLNSRALGFFTRFRDKLSRWETRTRLSEDESIPLQGVRAVVLGMGRIGTAAFDELQKTYPGMVLGVDASESLAGEQVRDGRLVAVSDATDAGFWNRCGSAEVELILLCLPNIEAVSQTAQQLREAGYTRRIAAVARYDDEVTALREAGVDLAFNLYREAGAGLVDDVVLDIGKTGTIAQLPNMLK